MPPQVIEGTWEEIESHKAELIGRRLRVTIMPERRTSQRHSTSAAKKPADEPKKLTGYGAFKDVLPSTEEYMREKQEEIECGV